MLLLLLLVVAAVFLFFKYRNSIDAYANSGREQGAAMDKKQPPEEEDVFLFPSTWANEPQYITLIQLWIWQVLLPLGGKSCFVDQDGFDSDRIAKKIGVFSWQYKGHYSPNAARKHLQDCFDQWQKEHDIESVLNYCPPLLARNIDKWAKLLGLNEDECAVLKFTLLVHSDNVLDEACCLLGELNINQLVQVLSTLLHIPEPRIRAVFSTKSTLFNTDLVKIDTYDDYKLSSKLDVLSSQFAELMTTEDISPLEMLKEHILNAPDTKLTLDHFNHLGQLIPALQYYLTGVINEKKPGCNILLYGMAGTGKTEFARVLAKALSVDLFEVSWVDSDGDPADRDDRLSALRAAQHIFTQQKAILLFDEIEDVFSEEQKDYAINKAWINRMMENNSVPTIWITNQVYILDPAMIRRFDFVVEMLPPPRAKRAEMLSEYTGTFLSKAEIHELSEHQILVPALLERSHKVTCAVQDAFPDKRDQAYLFQRLLGNTLKAQGYTDVTYFKQGVPDFYDIHWVNCKQDLEAMTQGLGKARNASLCLYGPSGTGKSAYVKWLSEQIGAELIYKRGSDLLSKYIGESEQLIAAAFDEARSNKAILLFDEVDSFLQDRRGATHSWEVTMVNEMLTQMEHFQGIFVATTNLMKNLDQAALRRFDFKIEFSFLKPEQSWALFQEHCRFFGLTAQAEQQIQLNRIHVLTPGDFAVAAKRNRVSPFNSSDEFLSLLREECTLKENGARGQLGFL